MRSFSEPTVFALALAVLSSLDVHGQVARGGVVAGQVVRGGESAAEATVRVHWLAHPELPGSAGHVLGEHAYRSAAAPCDARGRFRLELPVQGPFAVYAETRGALRSGRHFPVMAGDFVRLELRPCPVLEGTVVAADGRPVPGASVSTAPFGDAGRSRERFLYPKLSDRVRSDGEGRFRLPVWPAVASPVPGSRSLRAWTDDHVSDERFYRLVGQTEVEATLHLRRSTTVRGRVLSATGAPVAKARISDPTESGRAVVTDVAGRFAFPGALARLLVVHADGLQRVAIQAPLDGQVGDVRLERGVRLELRLLERGRPLAGRRVILASPVTGPGLLSHVPWIARVGEDGRLVLEGLTPGMPLSGFVERGERFEQFLCVVPPARREVAEVDVGGERSVAGQVVSVERQPLAGARVMLQPAVPGDELQRVQRGGDVPILYRMTYTDRGGRFRFDGVMAGDQVLAVNAGSEGFCARRLARGELDQPVEVRMPRGQVVEGTVVTPEGDPAAGAEIQYIIQEERADPGGRFGITYLRLATDASGRFRVRGVPAHGSYTSYALLVRDGRGYLSQLAGAREDGVALAHVLQPHGGRY